MVFPNDGGKGWLDTHMQCLHGCVHDWLVKQAIASRHYFGCGGVFRRGAEDTGKNERWEDSEEGEKFLLLLHLCRKQGLMVHPPSRIPGFQPRVFGIYATHDTALTTQYHWLLQRSVVPKVWGAIGTLLWHFLEAFPETSNLLDKKMVQSLHHHKEEKVCGTDGEGFSGLWCRWLAWALLLLPELPIVGLLWWLVPLVSTGF